MNLYYQVALKPKMELSTHDGIAVPETIRMAGVDDVKYANLLSVPLTTVHQPCADIGVAAVATMRDRLHSPKMPPRDVLLDLQVVVRESCGSVAAVEVRVACG